MQKFLRIVTKIALMSAAQNFKSRQNFFRASENKRPLMVTIPLATATSSEVSSCLDKSSCYHERILKVEKNSTSATMSWKSTRS